MIGLIDNVARVFVYGALLIFLSVKLTLAALFFLPFLMIASTRNAKPMKRIARIMRRKRAAAPRNSTSQAARAQPFS